jgi:hypothetical protein
MQVLEGLQARLAEKQEALHKLGDALALLDMLQSLAHAASFSREDYCRPTISKTGVPFLRPARVHSSSHTCNDTMQPDHHTVHTLQSLHRLHRQACMLLHVALPSSVFGLCFRSYCHCGR